MVFPGRGMNEAPIAISVTSTIAVLTRYYVANYQSPLNILYVARPTRLQQAPFPMQEPYNRPMYEECRRNEGRDVANNKIVKMY